MTASWQSFSAPTVRVGPGRARLWAPYPPFAAIIGKSTESVGRTVRADPLRSFVTAGFRDLESAMHALIVHLVKRHMMIESGGAGPNQRGSYHSKKKLALFDSNNLHERYDESSQVNQRRHEQDGRYEKEKVPWVAWREIAMFPAWRRPYTACNPQP